MRKQESHPPSPSTTIDVALEPLDLPRGLWSPQPVVNLAVRTERTEARLRFLVDTGAAITMIPKWIADAQGLPNNRRKNYALVGLGSRVEAYLHEFDVFLCGTWHTIPCAIAHGEPRSPLNEAVLGRAGIVDFFVVCVGNGRLKIRPI